VDTISVFVSYNHEQDARWLEQDYFGERPLIPWLEGMLRRQGVRFWYDRAQLGGGDAFRREIEEQIDRSQVAVLLVSRGFMESEFIREVELPRIEARVHAGEMTVIPIITRRCPWQQLTFLTTVLVMPSQPKPLIEYTGNEVEFLTVKDEILEGIERQVQRIRQTGPGAPPAPGGPEAGVAISVHDPPPHSASPTSVSEPPPVAPPPPAAAPAGADAAPAAPEASASPGATVRTTDRPGTHAGEEAVGPDGAVYVWVPPGEFMMGAEELDPEERPAHRVRITRGFWLSKLEVTNARYRAYCEALGLGFPAGSDRGEEHPVAGVGWDEATAYCERFGLALPTEAEWEYAARGPEGRRFPWGDKWDAARCCCSDSKGPGGRTFPVGSFPSGASWCGALDMAGNVWEWCADWFDEGYYAVSPVDDPQGPAGGQSRVLRGGVWRYAVSFSRSAHRHRYYAHEHGDIGFRPVVWPATAPDGAPPVPAGTPPSAAPRPAVGTANADADPATPVAVPHATNLRGTRAGEESTGPDRAVYVWVPPGEFPMGSDEGDEDERPVHRVRITHGFWLGKCQVTNAQYRAFCDVTGRRFPEGSSGDGDHPVVYVDWEDVQAYCGHHGLAQPTEAQWEYAARGPEGRTYPWGDEWDPAKCCNAANKGPAAVTFAVGSFPEAASWCGALDMAGNVWEWCADRYEAGYHAVSPLDDPPGPRQGQERVLRGGCWLDVDPAWFRCSHRNSDPPDARWGSTGFRCVYTP